MNDVWQEHRRFIMSLVFGALVVLIAWLVLDGIYGGKIERNRMSISRSRITAQQSLPPGVSLREIQATRRQEEEAFQEALQLVARRPSDGYSVGPEVTDADLHYSTQVDLVRRDLVELCALKNISVDHNLGQPAKFPGSRRAQDWYLRGLDVVRQVLGLVLASDLLLEGGITTVDNIKIGARPGRQDPNQPFMELIPVEVSLVGHPQALDTILHQLAIRPADASQSGRFLALLDARVVSLDLPEGAVARGRAFVDPQDRNRVRADLRLAAVNVNAEGSLR